jgi:hypothetical protein
MQLLGHRHARAILLLLIGCSAGEVLAQPTLATNKGTITLLTGFGPQFGEPGSLIETSPGKFVGIAVTDYAVAFMLTSAGAVSTLYTFPKNAGPGQPLVEAVNGRIYGTQTVPLANFSLSLSGAAKTYLPVTAFPPTLSIQLPDGSLYGTEWSSNGDNALVKMTVNGTETVLHSFSTTEGTPYGLPIRASDDNFYGISAVPTGHSHSSTSAMVYRVTPKGDLTIVATYPDGRPGYSVGSLKEYLVQGSNGMLYGTSALGGKNRAGAIFQVSLDGTYKLLYEFDSPVTGLPTFLTEGSDGNLYGVAQGQYQFGGPSSLFRVTPAGQFETLQYLSGLKIGTCPCWLAQGSDGLFYGTTMSGGEGIGTAWTWDLGLPKPPPSVHGVLPGNGIPGASVMIWGKNLLGATAVSFSGVPATFSNISKEYVSVTVPTGATTGPVTITTPNGTATSPNPFTVE